MIMFSVLVVSKSNEMISGVFLKTGAFIFGVIRGDYLEVDYCGFVGSFYGVLGSFGLSRSLILFSSRFISSM